MGYALPLTEQTFTKALFQGSFKKVVQDMGRSAKTEQNLADVNT